MCSTVAMNAVKRACFIIQCPFGVVVFMPQSEVLPGSPFIVPVWVHTFRRPIQRLKLQDKHWNPLIELFIDNPQVESG